MAAGDGIRRFVRLVLDKSGVKKFQTEAQRAINRGTDPKKATKNLSIIDRGFARLKKAALALGSALAGIWVVKKVFEYGKAIFKLGADVRAVQSQFDTVFGASAGVLSSFIEEFRRVAGLTRREAQGLAASAGSMAQGMGAGAEASADFAKEVLKLSADLASFNNVPTAQAAQLIQSALIGNTEAARSLGVSFTALDVQNRALAETGKASAKELTQLEKVMAGLSVITERAGPQIGDLARTQNDADNRAKQLSARLDQMKETIALGLMPALERLIPTFETLAAKAEAFANKTAGAVQALLDLAGIADQEVAIEIASITRALEGMEEAQHQAFLTSRLARAAGEYRALHDRIREAKQEMFDATPAFQRVGKSVEDMTNRAIRGMEEEAKRAGEVMNFISRQLASVGKSAAEVVADVEAAAGAGEAVVPSAGRREAGVAIQPIGGVPTPPTVEGPFARPLDEARVRDILDQTRMIEGAMHSAAMDVQLAWEQAFGAMFSGFANVQDAALALAKGLAGALVGSVAEYAGAKVAENIALAFEEHAKGTAALANPFLAWTAPIHFAAAKGHVLSAAKWAALSGLAGAAGSAVSGGGGGSRVGGGGTNRLAPGFEGERQGPEVHIYLDPFDPDSPLHQRQVGRAAALARERFGDQVPVKLHRGSNGRENV